MIRVIAEQQQFVYRLLMMKLYVLMLEIVVVWLVIVQRIIKLFQSLSQLIKTRLEKYCILLLIKE